MILTEQEDGTAILQFDGTFAMNLNVETLLSGGLSNQYGIKSLVLGTEHIVDKTAEGAKTTFIVPVLNNLTELS